MDYTSVPFDLRELKAAAEGGWEFTGYASTYGNVDHGGDVVVAGAFDESLKARPKPKLLWQHDMREPIGTPVSLKSDDHGLLGTWRIVDTARGADAYKLLKAGALDSLSIGYIPTEVEFAKDDETRLLKAVDLLEVSVVSVPMNERALVTAVKADQPFGTYWHEVTDQLVTAVARAEALERRRDAEGRELSESHLLTLKASVGQLLPALDRLGALIATKSARTEAKAEAEALVVRLELARRRLRRSGLLLPADGGAAASAPPPAPDAGAPDDESLPQ